MIRSEFKITPDRSGPGPEIPMLGEFAQIPMLGEFANAVPANAFINLRKLTRCLPSLPRREPASLRELTHRALAESVSRIALYYVTCLRLSTVTIWNAEIVLFSAFLVRADKKPPRFTFSDSNSEALSATFTGCLRSS
jgi:hypothetical protein